MRDVWGLYFIIVREKPSVRMMKVIAMSGMYGNWAHLPGWDVS